MARQAGRIYEFKNVLHQFDKGVLKLYAYMSQTTKTEKPRKVPAPDVVLEELKPLSSRNKEVPTKINEMCKLFQSWVIEMVKNGKTKTLKDLPKEWIAK